MSWEKNSENDSFTSLCVVKQHNLSSPEDIPSNSSQRKKARKNGLGHPDDFKTRGEVTPGQMYAHGVSLMAGIPKRLLHSKSSNLMDRSRPAQNNNPPAAARSGCVIQPGSALKSSQPKTTTPSLPSQIQSIKISHDSTRKGAVQETKKRGPKALEDSLSHIPQDTRSNSNLKRFENLKAQREEKEKQKQKQLQKQPPYRDPHQPGRPTKNQGPQSPRPQRQQVLRKQPERNNKKKKNVEIIELLDDSSDSDGDRDNDRDSGINTSQHKQQLTHTVNASIPKQKKSTSFGGFDTFPLNELYIDEERFAFSPVSPLKRNERQAATRSSSMDSMSTKRKCRDSSARSADIIERPVKPCEVTVNIAASKFKLTFPASLSTAQSPVGTNVNISFHSVQSISYSRIYNSKECYACLELTGTAMTHFQTTKVPPQAGSEETSSGEALSAPTVSESSSHPPREKLVENVGTEESMAENVVPAPRSPVHILLIFPDAETLISFDLTFSGRPQFTATRSPDDLIRDVREMPLDDMRVYNTCLLDPFHAKYFVLAHQLGVKGRKGKLTMTKRARRKTSAARYKASDVGMTMFCFPNDEFAQDTITFCKSDYIRLTDGEFLNDNVIDLQIKRAVLQRGVQEQLATGAGANGNLASSTASSLSPQLSQDGGSQEQNKQCPPPPPPVEDVKINPGASPHNTSPVYAFSCMFYTKLTENRQGLTKKNMVDAHRVVSRWTKHVDIFEKDFLFFPINIGAHWSLVCVVRPGKPFMEKLQPGGRSRSNTPAIDHPCILFMDSLEVHNMTQICNSIACYLTQEWICKKKKDDEPERDFYNRSLFPRINLCRRIPAQVNTYDCGVYLTKYVQEVCQLNPSSTPSDITSKFQEWFNPDMFSPEDVEEERLRITAFCDEQAEEWSILQAARKKKKDEAKKKETKADNGDGSEEDCKETSKGDDSKGDDSKGDDDKNSNGDDESTRQTQEEYEENTESNGQVTADDDLDVLVGKDRRTVAHALIDRLRMVNANATAVTATTSASIGMHDNINRNDFILNTTSSRPSAKDVQMTDRLGESCDISISSSSSSSSGDEGNSDHGEVEENPTHRTTLAGGTGVQLSHSVPGRSTHPQTCDTLNTILNNDFCNHSKEEEDNDDVM